MLAWEMHCKKFPQEELQDPAGVHASSTVRHSARNKSCLMRLCPQLLLDSHEQAHKHVGFEGAGTFNCGAEVGFLG